MEIEQVENITPRKELIMTARASGTFEVTLTPQAQDEQSGSSTLGRMSIDKKFHDDLEAVSKGQMLTAGTAIKDSAGYVAMERVAGSLAGRSGSFVLQHSGTVNRGVQRLSITVVPDSGTDQLAGLSGTMTITIVGEKHFYDFDYTLAGNDRGTVAAVEGSS